MKQLDEIDNLKTKDAAQREGGTQGKQCGGGKFEKKDEEKSGGVGGAGRVEMAGGA